MNKILTDNAIKYTLGHMLDLANPNNNIEYDININHDESYVLLSFRNNPIKFKFLISKEQDWYLLISEKSNQLNWISSSIEGKIPVLFWPSTSSAFVIRNEELYTFNGDIISSTFFMLTRWEEIINPERDQHGRFKYKSSVANKHSFIDIPIVDEYFLLLRKYLQEIFPEKELGSKGFKAIMSCDIDHIRRFRNIKDAVRTLAGDLLKTRKISVFFDSIKEYSLSFNKPKEDPYYKAIFYLSKIAKKNGVKLEFYIKSSYPTKFDSGYHLDNYIIEGINTLCEEGHDIGFHPGYFTYKNYDRFIDEKYILEQKLQLNVAGGRQHYLRFDISSTWKIWDNAGMKYDSTLGYAEREGFRCGTCHPFYIFDIDKNYTLSLMEIPLIVMEGTLRHYRNLSIEESQKIIERMILQCHKVEGVFTLLWHNTSVGRGWEDWTTQLLEPTLEKIGKFIEKSRD